MSSRTPGTRKQSRPHADRNRAQSALPDARADEALVPTEDAATAPAEEFAAALSLDAPLPALPPRDQIQLLVQSPHKLFVYWQYNGDSAPPVSPTALNAPTSFRLAVRLLEVDSGVSFVAEAGAEPSQWFTTQPAYRYQAEVGWQSNADQTFIPLLTSHIVRTPPATVAPENLGTMEFQVSAPNFARILNEAGYTTDALAVALEAADARRTPSPATTFALAHALGDVAAPTLGEHDLPELRALIAALALGESIAVVRLKLSYRLMRWLDALTGRQHDALTNARLLEKLHEMFGFTLEYAMATGDTMNETELTRRFHRTSSHEWSASFYPPAHGGVRVWLPSMAAGPAASAPTATQLSGSPAWLPNVSARSPGAQRWRWLGL